MSTQIIITDEYIVYPRPGGEPKTLDMTGITSVLKRIPEVALATRTKAPELLATFSSAYSDLTKLIVFIRYECDRADNLAEKRKAVVLLDESAEIIKKRGQNPTKELREAVVMMDEKYQQLIDDVAMLRAICKHLEGYLKSIDMAYMSVKKIYDNIDRPYTNINAEEVDLGEVSHYKIGKAHY